MDSQLTKGEKINIRMDFKDKEKEKFEVVKEDVGVNTNTEVIRHLINQRYKQCATAPIKVTAETERIINDIMIGNKLNYPNARRVIEDAVEWFSRRKQAQKQP